MPLSLIAGLLPGRAWLAGGLIAAIALAGASAWGYRAGSNAGARELAQQRAAWAALVAAGAAAARETEQRLQADVDSARADLATEVERIHAQTDQIRRLLPDAVAAGRLREQLAARAAGPAAGDTAAACRADAAALAAALAEGVGLLVEGAELAAALAAEHDERAAELAACVRAWPRGSAASGGAD